MFLQVLMYTPFRLSTLTSHLPTTPSTPPHKPVEHSGFLPLFCDPPGLARGHLCDLGLCDPPGLARSRLYDHDLVNSAQDPQLKTEMIVLSQNLAIANRSEVKGRVPRIFVGVVVVYLILCLGVWPVSMCNIHT